MEAYRDQYASIFRGGRGVNVIAISNDSPEELASWAADSDFPVLFATDNAGATADSFGTGLRENGMVQSRSVILVGPDGRVAWTAYRFREIDPTAYEELGEAVARVAPPLDDEGMEAQPGGMQAAAGQSTPGGGSPDC